MKNVWVALYFHKHGVDAWPFFEEQTESQLIAQLKENGEWNEEDDEKYDTYVEIRGPWPLQMKRQP